MKLLIYVMFGCLLQHLSRSPLTKIIITQLESLERSGYFEKTLVLRTQ